MPDHRTRATPLQGIGLANGAGTTARSGRPEATRGASRAWSTSRGRPGGCDTRTTGTWLVSGAGAGAVAGAVSATVAAGSGCFNTPQPTRRIACERNGREQGPEHRQHEHAMGPRGTKAEGQACPQAERQEEAGLPEQVPGERRAGSEHLEHGERPFLVGRAFQPDMAHSSGWKA